MAAAEFGAVDKCRAAKPFVSCEGGTIDHRPTVFLGASCEGEGAVKLVRCSYEVNFVCKGEQNSANCQLHCPEGCELRSRIRGKICGGYLESELHTELVGDGDCSEDKIADLAKLCPSPDTIKAYPNSCDLPRISPSAVYCRAKPAPSPSPSPTPSPSPYPNP